jgi:undecaprenyl-diphosphatase
MLMIFPIIILALVQGLTEFLPISSSGHLVMIHALMDDGLSPLDEKRMDIAVHIGTLLAVLIYFRSDVVTLVKGGFDLIRFKKTTERHKSLLIIISSIPVILCGFVIFMIDMTLFDSLHLMAWMTIIFGIVLYIADRRPQNTQAIDKFTIKQALAYGLAQCLALIPGVSRSGITMTAGRFLGHSRVEAARFSLLMGMITISAAGVLTGLDVFQDTTIAHDFIILMGIGIAISFIAAYIAILCMMKWFSSAGSMTPFVVYRIGLGVGLLIFLWF